MSCIHELAARSVHIHDTQRPSGAGQLASAEHAAQDAENEARDTRALLAKNEADLEGLSDAYNALEAANSQLESQVQQQRASGKWLTGYYPAETYSWSEFAHEQDCPASLPSIMPPDGQLHHCGYRASVSCAMQEEL